MQLFSVYSISAGVVDGFHLDVTQPSRWIGLALPASIAYTALGGILPSFHEIRLFHRRYACLAWFTQDVASHVSAG